MPGRNEYQEWVNFKTALDGLLDHLELTAEQRDFIEQMRDNGEETDNKPDAAA